jgi:tetratricopeptide (TPR) repeat protein
MQIINVHLDQVANRIRYFEGRFLRSTKEFFSIDIFNPKQTSELSSTEINGRFLFTQLLLDILLRMERKLNDKDKFIARCSELFKNDPPELKKLERFHRDYKAEEALQWYTDDSFLYRFVNKALRTQNMDLLFLYRFFIQDLQSQLAKLQIKSCVCVYRGQLISKEEWERLFRATGQYISMNSFLSTSLNKSVAQHFVLGNTPDTAESDVVPVLFQIAADPYLRGGVKPFAKVTSSSALSEEEEIVFMAGSIFRVTEVIIEESISTIKMELCSNEDNNLKELFELLRSEYGGEIARKENEASLNSFGIVLYNMDKFDTADRFFRRIYNEVSPDDPNRARYCHNIGNVALQLGQYEESARWYDRAIALYETNGCVNHPSGATVYLVRGNLYTMMNKRRRALASYNKALTIYNTNFGEDHPKIAICYHNMAGLFERQKHYRMSVEYRRRALRIAENTLPNIHPDLVFYHLALAKLLFELRQRELQQALEHAQKALKIANRALPPDHPKFLDIYATLGQIYELMKDFEQSTIWYNKLDDLGGLKSADSSIQRVWNRRKQFTCIRCHRRTWIYLRFEWMKDTRLNCIVFHRFGFFLLDIIRYCCHK